MSDAIIYDQSSYVESASNKVLLTGPDGIVVSMTPEAAFETGMKLIEGAAAAKGDGDMAADLKSRRERHAMPCNSICEQSGAPAFRPARHGYDRYRLVPVMPGSISLS
jgi:hypothetical protein